MSIVPNITGESRYDDLCFDCGRDVGECICGGTLPDDFDPLDEEGWDPDWDDYENDLDEGEKDDS